MCLCRSYRRHISGIPQIMAMVHLQPPFQHKAVFAIASSSRFAVLLFACLAIQAAGVDSIICSVWLTVDACVSVFNAICRELALPEFTKCTTLQPRQAAEKERTTWVSDGALIREIHITDNVAVGQDNVRTISLAWSTQRYRNSVPNLHTNGRTVDWKSVQGNVSLIYPCVYDKAHELELHTLPKIKSALGEQSEQFQYVQKIIDYCRTAGIVRFEQKLKSRYLQKRVLFIGGLSDYSTLNALNAEFLNLDKKLQVTAMDFESFPNGLCRLVL